MPRYNVEPSETIYGWIETVAPERSDAFLAWVQAASLDPFAVASGALVNRERGRRIYFADVPGARTRVMFLVFEVPACCVRILAIDDESFEAT